jgi:hypothetical protein
LQVGNCDSFGCDIGHLANYNTSDQTFPSGPNFAPKPDYLLWMTA